MLMPRPHVPLRPLIPLPHSSGPRAMPAPVPGCQVCAHLDTKRRPEANPNNPDRALRLSGAYLAHHQLRHP